MRPANPGSEAVVKSLCRLLALTLTVLYVLAIAGVAVDLVGWKCLASPGCLAGRSWLSWLGGRPVGLRLAVLALVPAAAIGLIWRVSAARGGRSRRFAHPIDEFSASRLGTIGQWDAEPLVGRLRSIHVAAAFATLDLTLLLARAASGATAGTIALTVDHRSGPGGLRGAALHAAADRPGPRGPAARPGHPYAADRSPSS